MYAMNQPAPIDQLQFRLFEIGIYLTQAQAEFILAKSHQAMTAISNRQAKQKRHTNTSLKQTDLLLKDESTAVLNHALSIAYKAYTPTKVWRDSPLSLSLIESEQMACPTTQQSLLHSKHPAFNVREQLQYCSQFHANVGLMWCAIDNMLIHEKKDNYLEKMTLSFPKEMVQWHVCLQQKGYCTTHYLPILIHPWQYKHQICFYLKEQMHERQFIGPLFKQTMFPTFDPSYLLPKNSEQSIVQTKLSPSIQSSPRLESKLKNVLKLTNHFKQTLYCLFEKTSIELKHSLAPLHSRVIDPATIHLTKDEWLVPLNSLINTNHYYERPLLIEMFDNKANDPFLLLKSLVKTLYPSHITLMKTHHLTIDSAPEHLLLVLKKGKVTKVIYRDPTLAYVNTQQQRTDISIIKTIDLIQKCYENHGVMMPKDTYTSKRLGRA